MDPDPIPTWWVSRAVGHSGEWTDTGSAFKRGRACVPALSLLSHVPLGPLLTSRYLPFFFHRRMMMTAPASWVSCEDSIN